jgi:two-component system, sensor histidine kinase RegB
MAQNYFLSRLNPWVVPTSDHSETDAKLAWLVLLRWLTVLVQMAAIGLASNLNLVLHTQVPVLAGLTGILALSNLIATQQLKQATAKTHTPAQLLFWMLLDWVLFLLPISLVSGVHNPFFPLIFLHVTLAAVLLPTGISLLFLIVVMVSVYLLNPVTYLWSHFGSYIQLSALLATAIESLILVTVWGFVHWVSLNLSHYRNKLNLLEQRQERLQRIQLLGALGAGVAHELATPLNTLGMRLQRLRRNCDETEMLPTDLEMALQAQAQCENKLRNLASLPTAENLSHLQALPLEKVVSSLAQNWAKKNQYTGLALQIALPPDFEIPLPEMALEQALFNLLDNALQAAGSEKPIQLHLAYLNQRLMLEVRDLGPGWPVIVKQHLGEPFVTTRATGTGLGLYTVYLLAQALGGQLELAENHPQGACARLSLPHV